MYGLYCSYLLQLTAQLEHFEKLLAIEEISIYELCKTETCSQLLFLLWLYIINSVLFQHSCKINCLYLSDKVVLILSCLLLSRIFKFDSLKDKHELLLQEYEELCEFTRYEKEMRDASILTHREVCSVCVLITE